MRSFQFSLASLLRYRRNQRDLCRQLLAQVLGDDAALEVRRAQLTQERGEQLQEIRTLGAAGTVMVEQAASRQYHAGQIQMDVLRVDAQRELIAQQLQLCRQALLQADQAVKALEKLEEKQRDEFGVQEERRAARELEETWAAGQWREKVR